jgi:hypothetical protein
MRHNLGQASDARNAQARRVDVRRVVRRVATPTRQRLGTQLRRFTESSGIMAPELLRTGKRKDGLERFSKLAACWRCEKGGASSGHATQRCSCS